MDDLARSIVESLRVWQASHIILMVSLPIAMVGFLALYGALIERDERIFSLPALLSLGLGTVFFSIAMLLHGLATPIAAENYLDASAGARDSAALVLGYGHLLTLSFSAPSLLAVFFSVGLVGASLVRAKLYNKGFAWAGVVLAMVVIQGMEFKQKA